MSENLKNSEQQLEKNIIQVLNEINSEQNQNLKTISLDVIEKLQKSVEEKASVSAKISDLKNKVNVDEGNSDESPVWTAAQWFRRK
jgi:hypothetical protein